MFLSGTSPCHWLPLVWNTETCESWHWPEWRTWELRWNEPNSFYNLKKSFQWNRFNWTFSICWLLQCRDVRTREVGIQEIHHKVRPYQVIICGGCLWIWHVCWNFVVNAAVFLSCRWSWSDETMWPMEAGRRSCRMRILSRTSWSGCWGFAAVLHSLFGRS